MNRIIKIALVTITSFAMFICTFFLLGNLESKSSGIYLFGASLLITVVLCLGIIFSRTRSKIVEVFDNIQKNKIATATFIVAIISIGVLIRFLFYLKFSYEPISDAGVFYETAQHISDGLGVAGNTYIAMFPYLAAYDFLLSIPMTVINDPWMSVIILNTLFDICAGLVAYVYVKRISKINSRAPLLVLLFWILNPFNILFSLTSLPIVVVNFFIITSLLITSLTISSLDGKKRIPAILLSLALGVVMGLGSMFRPVFTIVLIGIALVFLYKLMSSRANFRKILLFSSSLIIISLAFFSVQKINTLIIETQVKMPVASNASGWSMYVGSNWDSVGRWNIEDQDRMQLICASTVDKSECHNSLASAAFSRYKDLGIGNATNLFIRKTHVFSSNQSNVYDADLSIVGYADSTIKKIFDTYITLFIVTVFALSILFFYNQTRRVVVDKKIKADTILLALIIIGFFVSIIAIETAERYAQIMYPIFIVVAALQLASMESKKV